MRTGNRDRDAGRDDDGWELPVGDRKAEWRAQGQDQGMWVRGSGWTGALAHAGRDWA